MFPLEICIGFEKRPKTWLEPLTFDAAYLHAMVFSTQAYFDLVSGRQICANRQVISLHFMKALRLLRERLSLEDEQAKVSDRTITVVMALAHFAYLMGEC